MAKVGPSDSPQFSPFAQMQHGIAALSQPPKRADASQAGQGAPQRQAIAPSPTLSTPPAPVVLPAPRRDAVSERAVQAMQALQAPVPQHASGDAAPSPNLLTMKRFKVSGEESREMEQAALRLAAKLGVKVDFSKITRALWQVYLKHEDDVLRNASNGMTRQRPANDDAVGLAELDDQLSQIVGEGFRVASRRPSGRT